MGEQPHAWTHCTGTIAAVRRRYSSGFEFSAFWPQTGPHSDAVRQTRCKLWLTQIPLFLSPEVLARFLGVFRRGDAVIHKEKNYKDQIQGINNDRHVRSDLRAFYFAAWPAPSSETGFLFWFLSL